MENFTHRIEQTHHAIHEAYFVVIGAGAGLSDATGLKYTEQRFTKICKSYIENHFGGKAYPYFIQRKNREPMVLAGIWSTWKNPEDSSAWTTFSIVTTKANKLIARIHSSPDLDEPPYADDPSRSFGRRMVNADQKRF